MAGTPAREDYTGHELDSQTQLHYAGARYYMAAYGRWTTSDPILGEQGAAALLEQDRRLLTMGAYNYAFNDPVLLVDPDGRMPCPPCSPTDYLYQQAKGLWNQVIGKPASKIEKERVRIANAALENLPSADEVKRTADVTSDAGFIVGTGSSIVSVATGPDPSDMASVPAAGIAFGISDASDGVAFLAALSQALNGHGNEVEVVFRAYSATSVLVTGSMARKAAEEFGADDATSTVIEEATGKVVEEMLDRVNEGLEEDRRGNK